jgi:hypothetical protein
MTDRRRRTTLRYWERLWLMVFGLVLVRGFDSPAAAVASVCGWFIVLAAVGVVETAIALWYRGRRSNVEA